jgi:probable rRNA maturation factor
VDEQITHALASVATTVIDRPMPTRRSPYRIEVANPQRDVRLDVRQLRRVAEQTLRAEQVQSAEISIALVDDAEIWRVNKQFLNHDYPTDVVSFLSEVSDPPTRAASNPRRQPRGAGKTLSGEIVIGAAYAAREAADYGWATQDEVILYLVHGLLHLCGYDDLSPPEKRIMRRREDAILNLCALDRPPRRKAKRA